MDVAITRSGLMMTTVILVLNCYCLRKRRRTLACFWAGITDKDNSWCECHARGWPSSVENCYTTSHLRMESSVLVLFAACTQLCVKQPWQETAHLPTLLAWSFGRDWRIKADACRHYRKRNKTHPQPKGTIYLDICIWSFHFYSIASFTATEIEWNLCQKSAQPCHIWVCLWNGTTGGNRDLSVHCFWSIRRI